MMLSFSLSTASLKILISFMKTYRIQKQLYYNKIKTVLRQLEYFDFSCDST